jgi:transcriptional regulator of acetoin/glycerol metabolism
MLVRSASPEIDRLFHRLDGSGYLVSLASPEGVMLTFRCDPYWLDGLRKAGVEPGSVWAEEQQGTNGVGTCLKTGHTLSIIGDQHFNTAVKDLTCTVAPLFGAGGAVAGVLNVTSMGAENARTASLLRAVVENSARRIELHYFHGSNAGLRLLNISPDRDFSDYAALASLAVDNAGQIVEASSGASAILGKTRRDLMEAKLEHILDLPPGFVDRLSFQVEPAVSSGKGLFARMMPPPGFRKPILARSAVAKLIPKPLEVKDFADRRFDHHLANAEKWIRGKLPVIINGEAGVGRSFFARVLADRGSDNANEIILLNCAAPAEKLENLVADLPDLGSVTLILDQADEMALPVQRLLVSLLDDDLLEEVRLITIPSEPFMTGVSSGRIRRELADRLSGSIVALPPLRTAPDLQDICCRQFDLEAKALGRGVIEMSAEALSILKHYHWPGNLRELRQAARNSLLLAAETVSKGDLPEYIVAQLHGRDLTARSQSEAARIESALRYHGGNVAKTASYLGISRATLYRKVQVRNLRLSKG